MNEIIQPLRSYTDNTSALVKRHEALYYHNVVPLIADKSSLLPFLLYCQKLLDDTKNSITTCTAINYKTGQVHDILSYMTFYFGVDDTQNIQKQYVFYPGTSVIAALPQGIYYLHIVSSDEEWYSDLFKIGYFSNVCSFEFRSEKSFSHLWMVPKAFYYKATYIAYSFDGGESAEHSESYKNDDNLDIFTYRRYDKLRTVRIMGDSNAFDTLKIAQMCESIYLTDEINKRISIEITDVQAVSTYGNYLLIEVKYRNVLNSIITANQTPVTTWFIQNGVNYAAPNVNITFGGEEIEFNGEPIKFGP